MSVWFADQCVIGKNWAFNHGKLFRRLGMIGWELR
jgi:hypothetical protein